MADRSSIAAMRRQMYVPEDRPDYESYISDPENQRIAEEAALNLAMLAMGPLGEIPAGLRLAKNLYSGYRGLDRFTPRPDRGNAMLPDEMLQIEGPPARQALPRPSRPQMTEEELQAMEIARMVGEGGPSASTQAAARRETNRRMSEEERRANEVSRMESEGGMDPELAALLRSIKEERQRALDAEDLARFEGEGGGAWTYTGPRYKYGLPAQQGSREVMPFSPGARDVIPYGSSNTLPTMAGGGMDFLSPSMRFTQSEGRAALPGGGGGAGFSVPPAGGAFQGFSTRVPYNSQTLNTLRTLMPQALQMSTAPADRQETETVRPIVNVPMPEGPTRSPMDVILDQINRERAPAPARTSTPAVQSRAQTAAPAPAPEQRQSTGADVRALWEKYNETGSAADFIRADRAMQEAKKNKQDVGFYGQDQGGMKRGGSVEKKPDAVHKALEIIHHLVTR